MDDDAPLRDGAVPAWVAGVLTVIAEHHVERWTGCCAACGRAIPCPQAEEAMELLRDYRSTHADALRAGRAGPA
jgi:hypothetical protein